MKRNSGRHRTATSEGNEEVLKEICEENLRLEILVLDLELKEILPKINFYKFLAAEDQGTQLCYL